MGTVTISKDSGNNVTITQNPSPLTLDYGGKIAMNVGSGFPSDSRISAMTLFSNTDVGGRDAKGDAIGTWQRNAPSQPDLDLSITVNGNNIEVEDVDTRVDTKVWYSLQVSHGVTSWWADPEMIVKARVSA